MLGKLPRVLKRMSGRSLFDTRSKLIHRILQSWDSLGIVRSRTTGRECIVYTAAHTVLCHKIHVYTVYTSYETQKTQSLTHAHTHIRMRMHMQGDLCVTIAGPAIHTITLCSTALVVRLSCWARHTVARTICSRLVRKGAGIAVLATCCAAHNPFVFTSLTLSTPHRICGDRFICVF